MYLRRLLAVVGISAALVVPTTLGQAEAIAPGTYLVVVDDAGLVTLTVFENGAARVDAPFGVDVLLQTDNDGRASDRFVVTTASGDWQVDLDVDEDGDYGYSVTAVEPDVAG